METLVISKLEKKLDKKIDAYFRTHKAESQKFQIIINDTLTYENFLEDKMLIVTAISIGVPYSLFDLIQEYTPFSEKDWAKFLNISTKSLQRYKYSDKGNEHLFKPIHSEKIIEMAEVTKVGFDVFGNIEKLRLWFNTPNYALGHLKPIELLNDSYGKDMVISELIRIDHGIFV